MRVIKSLKEMADVSLLIKRKGKTIGLVPTMGALHEGHRSLIRRARSDNDIAVASIFVNPVQFGPSEDFKKYPRKFKVDAALCRKEGVDIIFAPSAASMYPLDYRTYVSVRDYSDALCGKFRPGHFEGVATVVAKLFNIVSPTLAYFGQKDALQALIIKKMVADLNMPVKIKVMPTIREPDGLAMSSRNAYLDKEERKSAAVLYRSLTFAKELIKKGNSDSAAIIREMKAVIQKGKGVRTQYIAVVDGESLRHLSRAKGKVLIALAAWVGKTRLIDNIIVNN